MPMPETDDVEAALARMRELAGDSERWPIIEGHIAAQRQEIDRLRQALEYIQFTDNGIGGCSSYYCVASKPKGGQHTNGPCNCDEPRLRRMLSHLRWYAGHVLEEPQDA